MMTANKALKIFLTKYTAEDCIKDYPNDPDYGCVKVDYIDNIEFIFGGRELSCTTFNYTAHWFIDSYGDNHKFILNEESE